VRDAFAGNQIPASRISAAAKKVQALYPAALVNQMYKNYSSAGAYGSNAEDWDVKLDHSINDANRITVRYSQNAFDQPAATVFGPIGGGAAGGTFVGTQRQAQVSYVRVIGARATNNLIASWNNRYPTRDQAGQGGISQNDLGIYGMPVGNLKLGLPQITFTNFQQMGSSYDTLYREWQTQDSLSDTFSLVMGRHTLKFGGQLRWELTNNFQPKGESGRFAFSSTFTSQPGVSGTGYDYATFLLGLPATYNYRIFPDFIRLRSWSNGLFVQDDFRVNRKLTINVGLRWDVPTWLSETKNRLGTFDLKEMSYVQLGTNGRRATMFSNTYTRFDPRIGFAYSPFGDQKTIVRAGYGIFTLGNYGLGTPSALFVPIFADDDMGRYTATDSITWKTTLDNIPYVAADKSGGNATSVTVVPDQQPMPYTQQWNVNVQHQFPGEMMMEVAYVGSHGVHYPYSNGSYNMNVIPLSQAATAKGQFVSPYVPYPRFSGGVTMLSYIGSMTYHSLQMKAERRFANGLGFLAAYTHNKQLDTGYVGYRDPLGNRNLDRGFTNTPQDRLALSYVWQLPVGPGQKWLPRGILGNVVGNWQFAGITAVQSGSRLNASLATNNAYTGNSFSMPNVSGDPMSGAAKSTAQWFRTGVFSTPADYTIGNAGRGLILGPGTFNTDLSAMKLIALPWREGMRLEFRGEFYNLFNQTHFSNPTLTVTSGTFGQILSSSGQRTGQLAMKFYF
jgi:hypothetical protein